MPTIKEKILKRGLLSNAKIIIPELNDSRVQKATEKLTSIGYNIVNISSYSDNLDNYLEM